MSAKAIAVARATERQQYTMTEDEWWAMGGSEPPEDYESGKLIPNEEVSRYLHSHIRTGPVPSGWFSDVGDGDVTPMLEFLADKYGVHMLTINWPDAYYPDFTAIPK